MAVVSAVAGAVLVAVEVETLVAQQTLVVAVVVEQVDLDLADLVAVALLYYDIQPQQAQ